jgi:hypothetical protein
VEVKERLERAITAKTTIRRWIDFGF